MPPCSLLAKIGFFTVKAIKIKASKAPKFRAGVALKRAVKGK